MDSGPDAPDGSGWGLMFGVIGTVSRDPCNDDSGRYAREDVDTAAELASAIAAWPGFESSEPVEVTVAGASGLLVEVTSTRTEADCPGHVIWLTPASAPVEAYPTVGAPGVRRAATFRIIEVDKISSTREVGGIRVTGYESKGRASQRILIELGDASRPSPGRSGPGA